MSFSTLFSQEIELEHQNIKLIPLKKEHGNALVKAASDGELWKLWFTSVPSKETIENYIHLALAQKTSKTAYPFVVMEKHSGKILGTTRYMNIDATNLRLEIGSTWYAKSSQRTGVNTSCKLALLQYAFETLNCIAVEFRTHYFNTASRTAIARLGAKQDGILRNHRLGPDGTLRDTVVFSIINSEWPVVKKALLHKMEINLKS